MSRFAARALFYRYLYMLRRKWLSIVASLVFPMIYYAELLWIEDHLQYKKFQASVDRHTESSLSVIPWVLEVVVCPDGRRERQLMREVEWVLQFPDDPNAAPLRITYVDREQKMIDVLAKWRSEGSRDSRGVHFHEISNNTLNYTIRPQVPNLTYTDMGAYRTTERFPSPMDRGPRQQDPYFDVYLTGKLDIPGIIQLQVAIDRAYISIYLRETPIWQLQSFPYPDYSRFETIMIGLFGIKLSSSQLLSVIIQFMMLSGILQIVTVLSSNIIKDKMSGIRELLNINGAPRWMINSSWAIATIVEAAILAVVELLIFKIVRQSILEYMTRPLLFFVLITLNWSTVCWGCFLSSIFTSEILCSMLTSVWWLISATIFQFIPPGWFLLQGLLATLPNVGLVLIFKAFLEFDGAETELGLDGIFISPIHYLSVGTILLIMLGTMIVVIVIAFYVDLVKPGPYGRAMPWYIFTRKEEFEAGPANDAATQDDTYFESVDATAPVGLECVNIYKFFGRHKALDNVTLKILKNKITVLLGHNGAGKTTLFSIFCGMFSPTKGHFYTENYSVFEDSNIKHFRKAIGYCPQYNLLLNELTVNQHLVIFGLLKGLSRQEAQEYSDKWTDLFGMEDMRKTQAKKLSGGSKRKLCLAIAMTGEPEYLLLDEPSSGLDAESIRKFWNIMLQEKGKCTVVVSTHNMDEAEILGDRVAFIGNGQVKAYGSISFLKKKLQVGYKLSCSTNEKELENFIKAVNKLSSSASIIHRTNRTVTFDLPSDKSHKIPSLMKSLDSEFADKIALTLSKCTMDDVFVKLFETNINVDETITKVTEPDKPKNFTFGQMKELFKKRIEWLLYRRLITMIIIVVGVPAIGMALSMFVINEVSGQGKFSEHDTAPLELTMNQYRGASALISTTNDDFEGALKTAMRNSGIHYEEVEISMNQALKAKASEDLFHYRSKIVFAFEAHNSEPIAYYSRNAYHTAPIAYSALINAIIHGKATIITRNFPYTQESSSEACSIQLIIGYLMAFLFGYTIMMASSYFVIFPHKERKSLFKHLQLTTGLLPATYWISNLIFDMAVFSLSWILMLVIIAIMDDGLFLNPIVSGAFTVVIILYGISTIPMAYVWSFRWRETYRAVVAYIVIHNSVIILYVVIAESIGVQYLYFIPWVSLQKCLIKISNWAGIRRQCHTCRSIMACEFIKQNPLFGQLKKELISMACMAVAYFALILAFDHGLERKLMAVFKQGFYKDIKETEGVIDPEVAKEKQRVRGFEMNNIIEQPELVCDGLGKKYSRKRVAVRDVTFATEVGELFGLVGANGAGKTTTFHMLSGLISPTRGDACIRGIWRLSDCEYKYIKNIAYCPQSEGLLPGLSGRTTLRLFGRLRWIKSNVLDSHVERWLEALDMTSLADRPCGQYSGGNKRKLSFAAAMIGNPSVVLLDEPTTGIDPIVRRRIWEILTVTLKHRNQAIVLTSHSMSECETICDRLTILVNGEMKCLGPAPKLKNTFGKRCTLHVKFHNGTTTQEIDAVKSKILSKFSDHIRLQEKLIDNLTFNLKTEKMKIHEVFASMLKIKDDNAVIDDFSLAETPLEEVFLMFAHGENESEFHV